MASEAATAMAEDVLLLRNSPAYLEVQAVRELRGSGGIVHDDAVPKPHQLIVMEGADGAGGDVRHVCEWCCAVYPIAQTLPTKAPKCTDCPGLFMNACLMRNAGASIHSHGLECYLYNHGQSFGRGVQTTKESHIVTLKFHCQLESINHDKSYCNRCPSRSPCSKGS